MLRMENKLSTMAQIEAKMLRYAELNETTRRADEEKELIKVSLGKMLKENHMHEHRVMVDSDNDVKVTVGEKTTKKLDKEELANDLGISLDAAGKKDILIKMVEEGRLTHQKYKGYEYEETKQSISIRKVKA